MTGHKRKGLTVLAVAVLSAVALVIFFYATNPYPGGWDFGERGELWIDVIVYLLMLTIAVSAKGHKQASTVCPCSLI